MRKLPEPTITVNVDITNPGQFFACCGLLELAERLWPGAEGWFGNEDAHFHIRCGGDLPQLIEAIAEAEMTPLNPEDKCSTPFTIGEPFRPLTIDWWETDQTGCRDLKVWAGSMESFGIAFAMQQAIGQEAAFRAAGLFDIGMVVRDPAQPKKKKEPYYFDSRRTPNAHSRDIGFSPNDLKLESTAHPAVELLCLAGLQVARPAFTAAKRIYDYFTWEHPLSPCLLLAASTGHLVMEARQAYRFENWFRTGQKKHKAFQSAIPLD